MTEAALLSPEPVVRLANAFRDPYDNAVAAARTCYSSRVIAPEEVSRDEKARERRDAIAESIYKAGHHTVIQHATFQFVLDKVSRHLIWSFLHSHPFYNSEQVSQRYVEVQPENFAVPPLQDAQRQVYLDCIGKMMDGYRRLIELVRPTVEHYYLDLFPNRPSSKPKWGAQMKKRQMEVARYVLPVATHAFMYHTVSGLTLHRYHRLCNQFDSPLEQRTVVRKMVEEVDRIDPEFFKGIEDPIPLEQTHEFQAFQAARDALRPSTRSAFIQEFDRDLGARTSKLVDYKARAEATMAQAVRSVLGLPREGMSDAEAIALVMHPAKNRYFSEALNLTTLGKLTRAMAHPHFTFRKKLSHTADSQDQRHRMTPASRPVLAAHFIPDRPDYVVPTLVQKSPEALEYYRTLMNDTWKAICRLLEMGAPEEHVLYLLPNAFPIRFEESGDLLGFHHKWTKRLCYTAQEEIWASCLEEVIQVRELFPRLGEHLLPPCGLRFLSRETPYCPEGDRFCGVPVWKLDLMEYERVI